ncbi:hypothetical protein [Micromonospora sp. NBC_00858]|uniref:hypothetical protein n=1 Tax=Micromonospora sp. NBC_00858 TaxID=2975979 RepID=UPI00386CED1F|nr:hypothetical protein OG990_04940 [Micromonospora sp. NBC_00858]
MTTGDEVAVPAQHRVGAHQQLHSAQHVPRQPVQQRRQERPITRVEPHFLLAQLALQHHDLVAQGRDLHILVPIAHRQQAQHRERVRHTQVRQSQQHGSPSCRIDHQLPMPSNRTNISETPTPALTRADGVFGRVRLTFGLYRWRLPLSAITAAEETRLDAATWLTRGMLRGATDQTLPLLPGRVLALRLTDGTRRLVTCRDVATAVDTVNALRARARAS